MSGVDAFFRELARPQREEREQGGPAPVWRRANVTAVDAVTFTLRTDRTADADLEYPRWYVPAVDDVVDLVQQGPNWLVLGCADGAVAGGSGGSGGGTVGPQGPEGPAGADGADGADGASAYEVAVANGFVGTEAAWLASLMGAQGPQGPDGPQGPQGPAGADSTVPGPQGQPGAPGATGASSYQVWLAAGNTGTVADYLASLKGEKGDKGADGLAGGGQLVPSGRGVYVSHLLGSGASVSGTSIANLTLQYVPLVLSSQVSIDRLRAHVYSVGTTAVSTHTARLGLCADDHGFPGPLLVDAGTIEVMASAGPKEIVLPTPLTLPAGVYWTVYQHNSNAQMHVSTGIVPVLPVLTNTPTTGVQSGNATCWVGTVAGEGPLPTTPPAGLALSQVVPARVYVKVV